MGVLIFMQQNSTKYFLRDEIGSYMKVLGETKNVVLVNADLMGTCRNKSFVEAYPERSFNVGIAEQNMVSFAAGLAHEGFIPYIFTMAPFMSMRACEQCRTDVAYAKLPVRLMATYAGVSGGISGATHWAIEDCAIMTGMPGMTVIELSDPVQTKQLLNKTLGYEGPIYFRSSVEPVRKLYSEGNEFDVGSSCLVRDGDDGAFLCSGVTVQYALEAAEKIALKTHKQIRVVDMYSIKPIDREAVISAAKTGRLIAAQDHNVIGGLGYAAAALIAEAGISVQFKILGVKDTFFAMAHAPYLYHQFEIDADGLVKNMLALLEG